MPAERPKAESEPPCRCGAAKNSRAHGFNGSGNGRNAHVYRPAPKAPPAPPPRGT